MFAPIKTFADSNSNSNVFINESELNKYTDDAFVESLKQIERNAIDSTTSEYYVRYIQDENGNVTMDNKKYTEEEYNTLRLQESYGIQPMSFNPDGEASNSWMRLKFESYKNSNGTYEFYVFYDWKTKPIFTGKDVVSLSYTSNITVDRTSARSHHTQLIINPTTNVATYSTQDYNYLNNSNFKSDINGIAFKFDLPSSPDTWPTYYNGYITAIGRFSNTQHISATMEMAYAHQQLGLAYDINDAIRFLQNGTVSVKINSIKDIFRVADEFLRY